MTRPEASLDIATPKARADVVFRSLSKEWVLYDPRSRLLHVLNPTAAIVWTCCDGSVTVEEIAAELSETIAEAPPLDQIVTDVRDALGRFSKEGLLE
jgi:hypothetical protein